MSRLSFSSQSAAQVFADKCHAWMQQTYPWYAESVKKGETQAYAIPYQDLDAEGKTVNSQWHINVKDRVMGALSQSEKDSLEPTD